MKRFALVSLLAISFGSNAVSLLTGEVANVLATGVADSSITSGGSLDSSGAIKSASSAYSSTPSGSSLPPSGSSSAPFSGSSASLDLSSGGSVALLAPVSVILGFLVNLLSKSKPDIPVTPGPVVGNSILQNVDYNDPYFKKLIN